LKPSLPKVRIRAYLEKIFPFPLTPTILGTFFHFHMNKEYFMGLLNLNTEDLYNNYIRVNLTKHIQQTIKALLIYES
jgi:hypothetical protein